MENSARERYFLYHLRDPENSCGFGFDGYIGVTKDLHRRKRQHFDALAKGAHKNKLLQSAFGNAEHFECYLVTTGSKEEIEARERLLVPKNNHHLNIQRGGGRSRGLSDDEARQLLSSSSNAELNSELNAQGNKGQDEHLSQASTNNVKIPASGASALALADVAAGAGVICSTMASGLGTAYCISNTILKDDCNLEQNERDARSAGRIGAYSGGVAGAGGMITAVYLSGEIGLGVAGASSGLTAIGSIAGGGAGTGLAITFAVPAIAALTAAGAIYGCYRLYKWASS